MNRDIWLLTRIAPFGFYNSKQKHFRLKTLKSHNSRLKNLQHILTANWLYSTLHYRHCADDVTLFRLNEFERLNQ